MRVISIVNDDYNHLITLMKPEERNGFIVFFQWFSNGFSQCLIFPYGFSNGFPQGSEIMCGAPGLDAGRPDAQRRRGRQRPGAGPSRDHQAPWCRVLWCCRLVEDEKTIGKMGKS